MADDARLIEITWDDHQFHYGEHNPSQGVIRITTCGFYVGETPTTISVALSRRSDGQFAETQVIDKRMLLKRRWIR